MLLTGWSAVIPILVPAKPCGNWLAQQPDECRLFLPSRVLLEDLKALSKMLECITKAFLYSNNCSDHLDD